MINDPIVYSTPIKGSDKVPRMKYDSKRLELIKEIIEKRPGIHAREIHRSISLKDRPKSPSTVLRYLKFLEKMEVIKKVVDGKYVRLYMKGIPQDMPLLEKIVVTIEKNEGIVQKELAKLLDLDVRALRNYLNSGPLKEKIGRKRDGKYIRYFVKE